MYKKSEENKIQVHQNAFGLQLTFTSATEFLTTEDYHFYTNI